MTSHVIQGIAVEVEGEGPVVVCIHGLGGTSNTWTPLLPAMQGYRIVRIDLPASGRSAIPSDPVSIDTMVSAVEAVCDELEVSRATFLGHSMGTIVCQHLATRNPALVQRLALFGPLLCPPDAGRPGILARADKAATGGIAAMQEIADAIVSGATGRETKENEPVVLAMVRESLMRQTPEGYAQCCIALAKARAAAVEQIKVPTLLVTGDQDGVAPAAAVEEMAARITNSRMVVFKACGHWTTFERPQECMDELNDFLNQAN
ncbi:MULTISPECIES: alpha/beta fold hydrolase [unclassified Massilia]|uniref:alpha/beta fold hydrolase n=1 Tax=unclassified Massilia TaxID=2609279 RepID=UPI001B8130C2|nr:MULTISPECIES: alpha/beta fold hydrolase [unclassified Massilia]MBQ5938924.1 alpha/beta fold hydrolase [Massilia sp. AB1]MBQ5961935.1 alpha/beta fold hydrolase [Massilia sp. ZL223]